MTAISKISVQHLCGEKQSNLYMRIKNIDKINNNFNQLMEAFKGWFSLATESESES